VLPIVQAKKKLEGKPILEKMEKKGVDLD